MSCRGGRGPRNRPGQFGARHFDLSVWYLAIPEYDQTNEEHRHLAELGSRAEDIAGSVDLVEGINFQTGRRRVREALEADGVACAIETVVASLIPLPE